MHFVSSEYDPEWDKTIHFIGNSTNLSLYFKESCCFWVFSPRIWNVLWMRFSSKNLLRQIEKWRDNPEITKTFLFYFWDENMPSPNIRYCPLNNTLNERYLSLSYGSVVSRRFNNEDFLVRIRSNYFFILWFF